MFMKLAELLKAAEAQGIQWYDFLAWLSTHPQSAIKLVTDFESAPYDSFVAELMADWQASQDDRSK